MKNTFYTIVFPDRHVVFAVCQDTYTNNQIVTRVKHRPQTDEPTRCSCDFVGVPECQRHFHKPFARLSHTNEVIIFSKLLSDASDLWGTYAVILSGYFRCMPQLAEVLEAVNCIKCGELLTNPESIKKGIGLICESY